MNIGNYSSSYGYQAYTSRSVETPQENSSEFDESLSNITVGKILNDSPMEDVIECGGVWTDNYMLEFHRTQQYFNPENPTITMDYSGVYGKTGNTINYSFEKSYEISLNSIDLSNASRADVLALAYYLELDHSQVLESEENKDDPFSKHNFIEIYEKEIAMLREKGEEEQADTHQGMLDSLMGYVDGTESTEQNLSLREFSSSTDDMVQLREQLATLMSGYDRTSLAIVQENEDETQFWEELFAKVDENQEGIKKSIKENAEKQLEQQWEQDKIIRKLLGQMDTDFTENVSRSALLGAVI